MNVKLFLEKIDKEEKEKEELLKTILEEEKRDTPSCENIIEDYTLDEHLKLITRKIKCNRTLTFDLISGKWYCPDCEGPKIYKTKRLVEACAEQRMLLPSEARSLRNLDSLSLAKIVLLRDNRYNYLYKEWEQAARGNRKAEFFLNRMKERENEINRIKTIGLEKVVKEEMEGFKSEINKLTNKISSLQSELGKKRWRDTQKEAKKK